jgi:hypothetical protein
VISTAAMNVTETVTEAMIRAARGTVSGFRSRTLAARG